MRAMRIGSGALEARLARALLASAARRGLALTIGDHRARPWASATFEGCRHDIVLASPRHPALGAWVAGLPEADLPMPGHLVASVAVERIEDDGVTVRLTLSVLTIAGD